MELLSDITYMSELTPTPIIKWYGGEKIKKYITSIGVGVKFADASL